MVLRNLHVTLPASEPHVTDEPMRRHAQTMANVREIAWR